MKYLPLKFHIIYIVFTLLFSFFGPREYLNYEKTLVVLFIGIYLLSVSMGFYLGYNSKLDITSHSNNKDFIFKLFKYSLFTSIVLITISLIYQILQGRLNYNLFEMGGNYNNYYEYYNKKKEFDRFTFELLCLVSMAIPKFISLCLGFFLFKSLKKMYKYFFTVFLLFIVLSQTISNGNQKSLGDIVIIGSTVAVIELNKINSKKRIKIISALVISFIILFLIFSYSQYSRLDVRGISASDVNNYIDVYSRFNLDHPIFSLLGDKMGLGVSAFITGYLSGGYYGLSQCLTLPFEWTYGIGNSVALSSFVEFLFSINIYEQTYLYRMEELFGIPGKKAWHTIFPWLASDVSFFGIPPLFIMISYFYGKSWKEIIIYKNPISLLLFSLLSILFVFSVANNQILHGYDYFLITIFTITFYIFKHKKFNIK